MTFSKDPEFLRNIILHHYDKPNKKVEYSPSEKYIKYQNKSATCIDDISAHILIESNIIKDIVFSGLGCAISTSSTNIMCNYLTNKKIDEAFKIIENYLNMINEQEYNEELLDELIAFYRISEQTNRIKCAQIGVLAIYNCLKEISNNGI